MPTKITRKDRNSREERCATARTHATRIAKLGATYATDSQLAEREKRELADRIVRIMRCRLSFGEAEQISKIIAVACRNSVALRTAMCHTIFQHLAAERVHEEDARRKRVTRILGRQQRITDPVSAKGLAAFLKA